MPSLQGDLLFADWRKLVGGLMQDTPLGAVIEIRTENDPERLTHFTPAQKAIRAEWQNVRAKRLMENAGEDGMKRMMENLQNSLRAMFSQGGGANG